MRCGRTSHELLAVARARACDPLVRSSPRGRCSAISELARTLALNRSTAHRYVGDAGGARLPRSRTARRASTASGRACSTSASRRSTRWSCASLARPHLQQLSDETGHTVNMAILDGTRRSSTSSAAGARRGPARDRPQPARRLAAARVLHVDGQGPARLPAATTCATRRLDRIELVTPRPEHADDAVRAASRSSTACATAGLAVNNEELAYGLRSIAAPVHARSGEVAAAINLAVHRSMVSMDDLTARLGPALEADRGGHLRARRLPRRGVTRASVASTETRRATRVRLGGLARSSRVFTVSIAAALLVWQLVSRTGLISERDLPPMSDDGERALVAHAHERLLARVSPHRPRLGTRPDCWRRVLAVPIGIFLGASDFAGRAFRVPIEFLRPIPSAALIPLLFLTLGTTLKSEVFLATFGAFWPLLIQTIYGVRDVDPVAIDTGAVVRARQASSASTASRCRARCRTSSPASGSRRRSRSSSPSRPSSSWASPGLGQMLNYRAGVRSERPAVRAGASPPGSWASLIHLLCRRSSAASCAGIRPSGSEVVSTRRAHAHAVKIGARDHGAARAPARVAGCGACTRTTPNFPRLSSILVEFRDMWLFAQFHEHVVPSLVRILAGFGDRRGRRRRARDPARPLRAGRASGRRRTSSAGATCRRPRCCRSRSSCCTRSANRQKVAFIALLLPLPGAAEHDRRRPGHRADAHRDRAIVRRLATGGDPADRPARGAAADLRRHADEPLARRHHRWCSPSTSRARTGSATSC